MNEGEGDALAPACSSRGGTCFLGALVTAGSRLPDYGKADEERRVFSLRMLKCWTNSQRIRHSDHMVFGHSLYFWFRPVYFQEHFHWVGAIFGNRVSWIRTHSKEEITSNAGEMGFAVGPEA